MECCVSFCENTSAPSANVSGSGISFHGFPSDVRLRAAWLRALGMQDSHLPDSAVVCSQHFLADDIYKTDTGLSQIVTGAIPSTVQVCMICLDTDSKMYLMSKHKLEEAYEKLTGHPLSDQGNLKPTLCTLCTRRLINFNQFRDQSLTSRALMMDLVEKHKLVTRQSIKMINCTKSQLKSNLGVAMLGPDPCDFYILEDSSEDKQRESEANVYNVTVKKEEGSYDCMLFDEEMEAAKEDDNNDEFVESNEGYIFSDNIKLESKPLDDAPCRAGEVYRSLVEQGAEAQDPLRCEYAPFQCTLCSEEFVHEHAYMQHMNKHIQNGNADSTSLACKRHVAVTSSCSHSTLRNKQVIQLKDDPHPSADSGHTSVAPLPAGLATNSDNKLQAEDTNTIQKRKQTFKVKKSYFFVPLSAGIAPNNEIRVQAEDAVTVHKSQQVFKIDNRELANQSSDTNCIPNINSSLLKPRRTHTSEKQYSCKLCSYKTAKTSHLFSHMRTHTGEKPFSCDLCEFKTAQKTNLATHMRTHTGAMPYSCELCAYKTAQNINLVRHMRSHTGEMPYSCKLCKYKCTYSGNLVRHLRTHTGEKPYTCELCEYKTAHKFHLVRHMRTHTV